MQKKLLALAVAGALVPMAAMAQSSVEIYGRANLGIDNWKADGAAAGGQNYDARMRIYDGASRLGFRVNEQLGGGMRAFVVMETGVNVDSGTNSGQSGATNSSTGFWASRDSYLGLGGGWGDVRFGRQSIFWSNGVIAQTGANYINTAVDGMLNGNGISAVPVTRQSNVVSYNSPTFSGFNATLSYSPGSEGSTTFDSEGRIWGITGRYTSGALRAQFDYATNRREKAIGATTDPAEDKAWKVGLGWAYAPGSQISAVYESKKNDNHAAVTTLSAGTLIAAGDDIKQNVWLLNWEHMLGQWQLLAQYVRAGEIKGGQVSDNTKSQGYTLAAKYFLSKRTGVYASYNNVKNEDNAFADLNGAGYSSAGAGGLTAASAGADVKIWAVGVMHNF